jgi:hypothetical protein
MKTYNITIKGTAPLLMNKAPDFDVQDTERKGEGKDSPDKCEGKLYKNEEEKIVQPSVMIEQAMNKTASSFKQKGAGKKTYKELFIGSVFVKPDYIIHKKPKWEVHKTSVKIGAGNRVARFRPLFKEWELDFQIEVMDDRIEEQTLKAVLDEAGRTKGIGDWRPRFGRFIVTKFQKS